MIRLIARWAAKKYYVFSQEFQASTADLHAGLSLRLAGEKRALIEKLNKEAEDIEANIKSVDEKLDKGYWECENGHGFNAQCGCAGNSGLALVYSQGCILEGVTLQDGKPTDSNATMSCPECFKRAKFISRTVMTGQEKYESDREKAEAQKIAESKRAQAKAEDENAVGSEKAAKYFQDQAKSNRTIAERIRSL
jgi:hypothetical protein